MHVRHVIKTGFSPFNPQAAALPIVPSHVQQPTARLLCQNLPQEVTDNVLSVLFQE